MLSVCRVAVGAALAVSLLRPVVAGAEASSVRPDYTELVLRGDGMRQDSFSLALQAAARALGREADYQTVAALTTNTFSPAINPGEDCMSWWHVDGHLSTAADLGPLASRAGLRIVPLALPAGRAQAAVAEAVRQARAAGAVVVADGGWQVTGGPHGFVPWGWAGVITEVKYGDTVLVGACLNGERDNPLTELGGGMWAITAGEDPDVSRVGDLATLRQVVARLRGTGRFARSRASAYGLDAMDLWIKQMEEVSGFCRPCQARSQRGWSDAFDNGVAMRERSLVAASYLRRIAPIFTAAAREDLESAARGYDRVASLLAPAVTGEAGETYDQFVGDLAKQKAHSQTVLRPIREELGAIANDLEQALARPLPEAVLLHDVPAGREDGHLFARGLEVLLAQAGTQADYDTLMGDLGLAFMLQASDQVPRYGGALDVGWWPLDPACAPTYLDFAGRALGRRLEFVELGTVSGSEISSAFAEKVQPRAVASLKGGTPFLAVGCCWWVATGYDEGTPPLLGFWANPGNVPAKRFPSHPRLFAFLGEEQPRLDRRAADREALRHAVALGRDEVSLPGGWVTGRKAFALWIQTLRDTEHLGEARWHWNTVGHLQINRKSAIAYLRAMAKRQPEAAAYLKAAAARYEQTLTSLKGADLSEAALTSPAGREKVAAVAERIARNEAEAIGELEQAIAVMSAAGVGRL